ncbi:MAG: leucine-rich repeat protein [Coprobacillus sp.]
MRKRIINLLLAFITCMSMCMTVTPLYAADESEFKVKIANENGDEYDVDFKIISETDKTVQLGTGYLSEANKSFSGDLVIPETVTHNDENYNVIAIAEYAFDTNTKITSVKGDSIKEVGYKSFSKCGNLTSVHLPEATTIRDSAFSENGLTLVDFPQAKKIEVYAFQDCGDLTFVNLPQVTTIDQNAFVSCVNLEVINIPKAIEIGYNTFDGNSSLKVMVLGITKDVSYQFGLLKVYPKSIYLPKDSGLDDIKFGSDQYLANKLAGEDGKILNYSLNVTNPSNIEKERGKSAELTVVANVESDIDEKWLSKDISYQWQKNVEGSWTNLKDETAVTLKIDNLKGGDVGKYRCMITPIDYIGLEKASGEAEVTIAAITPEVGDSKVTGIEENKSYSKGSIIEFTVNGAGMDNTSPIEGDLRYVPKSWKVNPSGDFTDNYSVKLDTKDFKLGKHELQITFEQQKYESGVWENTGVDALTKSVSFVIGPKDIADTTIPNITSEKDLNDLVIKDGETVLVKDVDYTVKTEKKDTKVIVTVTGKGNYAGTVTREYTVSNENISDKKEQNTTLPITGDTSNIIFLSLGVVLSGCILSYTKKNKKISKI